MNSIQTHFRVLGTEDSELVDDKQHSFDYSRANLKLRVIVNLISKLQPQLWLIMDDTKNCLVPEWIRTEVCSTNTLFLQ